VLATPILTWQLSIIRKFIMKIFEKNIFSSLSQLLKAEKFSWSRSFSNNVFLSQFLNSLGYSIHLGLWENAPSNAPFFPVASFETRFGPATSWTPHRLIIRIYGLCFVPNPPVWVIAYFVSDPFFNPKSSRFGRHLFSAVGLKPLSRGI